jgi:hypothetical protein
MAVIKPRSRLVYFRVTEDEFHRFMQLCERNGSRSISDLIRDTMHRLLIEADEEDNGADSKVRALDRLIAEVSAQLQQLAFLQGRTSVDRDGLSSSETKEIES